ncbi:MAG: LPXTG cell wall anchor domain-containing protein [Firmicutes bacterium]|nr:LPXTG cell wall anchor domain-containing protein [Bacillota bacterium]
MKHIIKILLVMLLVLSMATPAFAVEFDFAPSVSEKPAPGLVALGTCKEHNLPSYGWILDANGNEVQCLHEGQILVTPLHKMDEMHGTLPAEVIALIWEVYEDLHSGDTDLEDVHGLVERIKAELGEYAETHHLSIYELFDVTILDANKNVVPLPDGHSLKVKFDVKFPIGAFLEVMSYAEDHWQLAESVEIVEDGVYVIFDHLCPVVFLVEGDDVPAVDEPDEEDGDDKDVPKTGDTSNPALWGATAAAALAGMVFLMRRKKTEK